MVNRDEELWAATRTLAMHERDGRCVHCTRDGCRMRTWALAIRRLAADDGLALPPISPAWSSSDTPASGTRTHRAGRRSQ